jgi:POT family proton-dependent oligopeptide transporter
MRPIYVGLVLMVFGSGILMAEVATMVGQLYREGDNRRDAGFTVFYMGINLGAALAPIACSYLGEKIGWHYGFGAAGVGMLLGLGLYLYSRNRYLPGIGLAPGAASGAATAAPASPARNPGDIAQDAADAQPGPGGTLVRALVGAAVAGGLALAASGGSPTLSGWLGVLMAASVGASVAVAIFGSRGEQRRRVLAIVIIVLFAVFFWLAFEQAGSSMTLFADRYTDRTIGTFSFPTGWFQVVQPFFIITLAPVAAAIWLALARSGREPSTALKMVLGLVLVGAGFLFLVVAGRSADRGVLVSPFWLVGAYFLHSVGELCLSPVGLSYVTKVAPTRFVSLLMGVWFIALAAANYLGGYLASKMGEVGSQSEFFTIPVVTSFGAALLMLLLVPWIKRLTRSVKA